MMDFQPKNLNVLYDFLEDFAGTINNSIMIFTEKNGFKILNDIHMKYCRESSVLVPI